MLPLVGIAGKEEDAALVQGIRDADYDAVNIAIEAGARLNQQLNDEGQTPLALAQALLQDADEETRVDLQNIIDLLRAHYAPIYVMFHPANTTQERNDNQAGHPSPFGIFPQDIANFIFLIPEVPGVSE